MQRDSDSGTAPAGRRGLRGLRGLGSRLGVLLLGTLLGAGLGRCGPPVGPTVLLNVSGQPAEGSLRVVPMLDGKPLKAPYETQSAAQLALQLAPGTTGRLTVEVRALGSDGCATHGGRAEVDVAGDEKTQVLVTLTGYDAPLCAVTVTRTGSGAVTSDPPGLSCGETCMAEFPRGTSLKLTAQAARRSSFGGWSGACSSGDSCTLPVNGPRAVAVQFQEQICLGNGLCWESPSPLSISLRSVWASAPDDAWAVGELGALLHYDGTGWRAAEQGVNATLNAVWGAARDKIWAVGDAGTVLFYNGTSWSPLPGLSVTANLTSVQGNAAGDDVWIAGGAGTLLHLEGGTFVQKTGPLAGYQYSGIAYSAPDFVVFSTTTQGKQMAVWNGTAFSTLTLSIPEDFFSYGMSGAPDTAWAVGYTILSGIASPAVLRIGRTTTERVPVVAGPTVRYLRGVHARAANDVWMVGDEGTAFRWNGERLIRLASTESPGLLGVSAASADAAFAVGSGGALARWNGYSFVTPPPLPTPTTGVFYQATVSSGPSDIWAGGSNGTLVHYDGSRWTQIPGIPQSSTIRSLSLSSTGEVWAAGSLIGGQPMVLRGTLASGFSTVGTLPSTVGSLTSVAAFSSTSAWVVGGSGLVWRWSGTAWSVLPMPATPAEKVTASLQAVVAASTTDAWIGGYLTVDTMSVRTNTIYHTVAEKLVAVNPPTGVYNVAGMTLSGGAVWMAAADTSLARNMVLRADVRTATIDPPIDAGVVTSSYVRAIAVQTQPAREIWLIAPQGIVLRQPEGGMFSRLTLSNSGPSFYGITVNGPGDVTLVGDPSLLVRATK